MNIRGKLIILFVSIVALIFLATSVAIYFFSSDYRADEFYKRMENKGKITAKLFIEVDEVNEDVLRRIEADVGYVEGWSFGRDVMILFRTPGAWVFGRNAG